MAQRTLAVRSLRSRLAQLTQALFGTFGAAVTTVLVGVPVVVLGFVILRFVFATANWQIITDNLRLFYLGTYPLGEEWRVWIPLYLLALIAGLSVGLSGAPLRTLLGLLGGAGVLLLVLGLDFIPTWLNAVTLGLAQPLGSGWVLTLLLLVVTAGAAVLGRVTLQRFRERSKLTSTLALLWGAPILLAIALQLNISPNRWNGLFLDIMVFSVGGLLSLPLGILLALGRTSQHPVVRYATTGYIEIVRAGPLVVWLILALFLWNDLLFDTNKVHRAMLVFGFFGAAYVAEVVRGGLQSIPRGQFEASRSLGLKAFSIYTYVIVPQALRAVIPALVGRFIALWKDTSLLLALSLINTLEVATAILEGRPSNGQFLLEIYLIIALFYWLGSFSLSRVGRRLERAFAQ